MHDFEHLRQSMIDKQLKPRGIRDQNVLQAMHLVPREAFVPEELREFAYEDAPLPIGAGQTISQPYIVAAMTELLELSHEDRVLEIGTGSGYAAAILSRMVREVVTMERYAQLAERAGGIHAQLGYDNIKIIEGDGSLGLPERAPFDAIVVTAGAPEVPRPLKEQLAIGGRLVIPIGPSLRQQALLRIRRNGPDDFSTEEFEAVRFVPLIGRAGWQENKSPNAADEPLPAMSFARIIGSHADIISSVAETDLNPLMERIGEARIVLLGESTHGTAEFYEMRARITRQLIEEKEFNIVAIEADWPDAARLNGYIRGIEPEIPVQRPFSRFPIWMWANTQFAGFVESLREYNLRSGFGQQAVHLYGLDLYSMYSSIAEILHFLDARDPQAAAVARRRYGCLTPWQQNPAIYGAAVLSGQYRQCENEVVEMLQDLLKKQTGRMPGGDDRMLHAIQNARLVANAERYYRIMYYGSRESWNLRDQHMFDTLKMLLEYHGPDAKMVVWEHNSHIGDADATEMGAAGEKNVGSLCRKEYGRSVYSLGFGTDHGSVAAASQWDEPMQIMEIRPAVSGSYEHICHQSGIRAFVLPLNARDRRDVRKAFLPSRLERAIGVIYAPQTELQSHYFRAVLPDQFDEYIWFDETRAITPLNKDNGRDFPGTYPLEL